MGQIHRIRRRLYNSIRKESIITKAAKELLGKYQVPHNLLKGKGSGKYGNITKQDVLLFLESEEYQTFLKEKEASSEVENLEDDQSIDTPNSEDTGQIN